MACHRTCIAAVLLCGLVASSVGELLPDIDEAILRDAWTKAEDSLDLELSKIEEGNKFGERQGSAYGLKNPKIPREEALQVWRSAEIFARAVERICETQNVTHSVGERLMERAAPRDGLDPNTICRGRRFSCNRNYKYRRIDGACNNLERTDQGMTVSFLARLLPAVYADNLNAFRRSVNGGELPLARLVSTMVIPDIPTPDRKGTHMLMMFGQFLNHDLTSTPHRTDLDKCCGEHGNNPDCVPIRVPTTDPQLANFRIGCMEFARSHRACGTGARQQMNQNTAYIDGSQVYGSTESEQRRVRLFRGGLLQFSNGDGPNMLPPQNASDQTCVKPQGSRGDCFIAGDNRANENPGLSAMHVIFLREHNRIARELSNRLNNDEAIFQEARRIVIAEMQNIVYSEFLPTLLSRATLSDFVLGLPEPGSFTRYDPSIDASTVNSFSTAAYRFGHSLIQGQMNMPGTRTGTLSLSQHFNNPSSIHQSGVEPLLAGGAQQPSQRMDNFVTEAVTRQLFREGNNPFGMDLAALNIQRGRDHGLPPWNAFRSECNLTPARSETDLRNFFVDADAVRPFMEVYNNQIGDFDLWPAGIAEKPKDEGMIGPTFSCILGIQFNRLKWGDRFFLTHSGQVGSFTRDQLANLRRRTLASIICDNSGINSIQTNVFRVSNSQNSVTGCLNHPKLDMRLFP